MNVLRFIRLPKALMNERGITLVETLFAFLIAGIAIFAMMMTFPKMKMLVNVSQYRMAALEKCQTEMESLKQQSYASLAITAADPAWEKVVLGYGYNKADGTTDLVETSVGEYRHIVSAVQKSGTTIGKRVAVETRWVYGVDDDDNELYNTIHLDMIIYDCGT